MIYVYTVECGDSYDPMPFHILSKRELEHGEFHRMVEEAMEHCRMEDGCIFMSRVIKYLLMAYSDIFVDHVYKAEIEYDRRNDRISQEYDVTI